MAFLLQENGSKILLEDGTSKLLLEDIIVGGGGSDAGYLLIMGIGRVWYLPLIGYLLCA